MMKLLILEPDGEHCVEMDLKVYKEIKKLMWQHQYKRECDVKSVKEHFVERVI